MKKNEKKMKKKMKKKKKNSCDEKKTRGIRQKCGPRNGTLRPTEKNKKK